MKGLFIVNPSSGKQVNQAKALQAMSDLLKDGIIDEASVSFKIFTAWNNGMGLWKYIRKAVDANLRTESLIRG